MKKMKVKEIREMTTEEINKKIKKIKKEHINEIYRKKAKAERGK